MKCDATSITINLTNKTEKTFTDLQYSKSLKLQLSYLLINQMKL